MERCATTVQWGCSVRVVEDDIVLYFNFLNLLIKITRK